MKSYHLKSKRGQNTFSSTAEPHHSGNPRKVKSFPDSEISADRRGVRVSECVCAHVHVRVPELLTCVSAHLWSSLSSPVWRIRPPHTKGLLETERRLQCVQAKVTLQPRVFLWLSDITLSPESVWDGLLRSQSAHPCSQAMSAPSSNKNRVCLKDWEGPISGAAHVTLRCWHSAGENAAYKTVFTIFGSTLQPGPGNSTAALVSALDRSGVGSLVLWDSVSIFNL